MDFIHENNSKNNHQKEVSYERAYVFSLLLLTMLLIHSVAMVGNADALWITDRCIVEGSGTLPNGDMLSGSVVPVNGVIAGTWEHWQACENTTTCNDYSGALYGLCNAYCKAMDCAGDEPNATEEDCEDVRSNFLKKGGDRLPCEPCFNHLVGDVDRMFCWRNGVVLADLWGTGSLNGVPGYGYQVHMQDYGASGPDLYQIYIWAPDGSLAGAAADYLSSGNINIPYPVTP